MSHLAVQVDSIDQAVRVLRQHHVTVDEPSSPDGTGEFLTVTVKDPDGRDIELCNGPRDTRPGSPRKTGSNGTPGREPAW